MKNLKILTVLGARPHFIKAAALSRAFDDHPCFSHVLVHSGQHYDDFLSGCFFREFQLSPPDYNLNIGSDSPNIQIARCMEGLDMVFEKEKPDIVLVIGDTNTTAAGAIAAKMAGLMLGHIEAGLREFRREVPEEINKLLIDAVSDFYFAPTRTAVQNLELQGITKGVYLTGDITLDLLVDREFEKRPGENGIVDHEYVFLTCHRQANTRSKTNLESILRGVSRIDLPIYFSVHPRTRKAIEFFELSYYLEHPRIKCSPPLNFWDTQQLIRNARAVITDSGGIIRESYFHRVPSIIIDSQSEWIEIIDEGWSVIAGHDSERILEEYGRVCKPSHYGHSLGDGSAGKQIAEILKRELC